ncbi:MAG: hypothetical protein GXO78_11855 [Calditrichaeota bacterium]|nr:hypothetical protein [Calditrichota bacterium]
MPVRNGIFILLILAALSSGQVPCEQDSVYWKNFVRHADGSTCTHVPPQVALKVFRASHPDIILLETTPRREPAAEANVPGSGVFGVELANFSNPGIRAGDTVTVQFTCLETQQRGTLTAVVQGIPWYYFPTTLYLQPEDFPGRPENITIQRTDNHQRIIQWEARGNLRYRIYRSSIGDTLCNGQWRREYRMIAEGIQGGVYQDTVVADEERLAYVLIAYDSTGTASAHSREVIEADRITGLQIVAGTTTAQLQWLPYQPPFGTLAGYTIYRREKEESVYRAVGYTSGATQYLDTRLQPGTQYVYKIVGRIFPETEAGTSDEVMVATGTNLTGKVWYTTLRVAVVIYQHTNRGGITAEELSAIRSMLETARLFIWRNSGFQLNLELDFYPISAYRGFGDSQEYHLNQTAEDLRQFGVMNTQYDLVFRICPAISGYWSLGVVHLNLPGPERLTGFSHTQWPVVTAVRYPGQEPQLDYGLTWIFVHEIQHAIDALYHHVGHPEMYHGDRPWDFPDPCGEHFDFQANIWRSFKDYRDLPPEWGEIYESVDQDQDGLPDIEPLVPLDEVRFGSAPDKADTDGDGLNDLEEAMAGIYTGSDPTLPDTDDDGREDGSDTWPLYAVSPDVPQTNQPPRIDGFIESGWPVWSSGAAYFRVPFSPRAYLTWDADSLYLALEMDRVATPVIYLDVQADGWWHSAGNVEMVIDPESGTFSRFRSWDASEAVKQYSLNRGGPGGMWDTDPEYQQQFQRRVIDPATVHLAVLYENPVVQLELAIPRSPLAGLNLQAGDSLGINVVFEAVDQQPEDWASLFERYDFVTVTLREPLAIAGEQSAIVPNRLELLPGYPNPFNPATTITVLVPRKMDLEVAIFDVMGRRIQRIVSGEFLPGRYKFVWNGMDETGTFVSGGVYFCRLKTSAGETRIQKLLLLR